MRIFLFGCLMFLEMLLARSIFYELQFPVKVTMRSCENLAYCPLMFDDYTHINNYNTNSFDVILIANYVICMTIAYLLTMYVINFKDKSLSKLEWLYKV